MSIFDQMFGGFSSKPEASKVDQSIAATVWMEKTPIFQKLPGSDDEVIKIKAGDFRRVMRQAYIGGFERASKP